MDWFHNLFFGPATSIAHIIAVYAFVIAVGNYLGKFKVYGISLGVTFVLFIGLLMGHMGLIQNILYYFDIPHDEFDLLLKLLVL